MPIALTSGAPFPLIDLPALGGGTVTLGGGGGWQLIFVYRGLHCPICKGYMAELETHLPAFKDLGLSVVLVSGDPVEKAASFVTETGVTMPVGHDLTPDQMRTLGLYISEPRSPKETDRPFAEPGLFLVNPEGNLHMVDVSNAPFLRPGLEKLASRIGYVLENDYPIRGTMA
ncbi:MAG: redoxin domain-containing protein [Pseudomonadota bacterium]